MVCAVAVLAASPAIDHSADREHVRLLAVLLPCDELDADLLAVLALTVGDTSRSRWAELARGRGVVSATGRALSPGDVVPCAGRLVARGLVQQYQPTRKQIFYAIRPAAAMAALELADRRGRLARLTERKPARPWEMYADGWDTRVAQVRVAATRGDAVAVRQALARTYARSRDEIASTLLAALGAEPEPVWLALLPDEHCCSYLQRAIRAQWLALRPVAEHVIAAGLALHDKDVRLEIGRALAVRGDARASGLDGLPRWGREGLALLAAFWAGDYALAHEVGERAASDMKTRKRAALPDLEGICHILAAVAVSSARPEAVESVGRQLAAGRFGKSSAWDPTYVLGPVHRKLIGASGENEFFPLADHGDHVGDWMAATLRLLHDVWLRPRRPTGAHDEAARRARLVATAWHERAQSGGYDPVARELAAIRAAQEGRPEPAGLAGAFDPPAPWKAALASVEAMAGAVEVASEPAAGSRAVVWEVELIGHDLYIQPRVRSGARSRRGQPVPMARLRTSEIGLLDDADRRVLAAAPSGRPPELGPAAAVALIGHPRVVTPDGQPIAVERGRPVIQTRRKGRLTRVELMPPGLRDRDVLIEQAAPGRLVVYERGPELGRLAELLGRGSGLVVPDEGRDRLARALARLGAAASADIDGDLRLDARDATADARPVIQLAWDGAALRVRLRVAPLGLGGPLLRPGAGLAALVAEVRSEGGATELRRCERDLADERRRCEQALDACPALAGFAAGELEWLAPSLDDALEVMLELGGLGDDVALAWQAGQRLSVPRLMDLGDLRLNIASGSEWLDVDAALPVDESTVLGFRELLRSRQGTRFVALDRGRFLALSDRLRRHLDQMETLGSLEERTIRASVAVLPLVEELASATSEPSFDAAARARLDRLRAIAGLSPRIPRGFGATLRDYQREGFEWMARLAEADLGACLADDMGLGKTLQALALLVHRAPRGPALILCPSSVVHHWVAEAARFAPSLQVRCLSDAEGPARADLVGEAGSRHVLVASYGLLASEVDLLAGRRLATVVFDEAHALKNPRTQRAAAARRLQADFRLALTGTPIENHLGELWSLFATILPGLLGTRADYEERFAGPTAGGLASGSIGDRERAARLRALVRPFLLRRLKTQVLDELPPRTEITLRIAPYPEQAAFYEAVRRQAIERTADLDAPKARFQVLAEITRLRQAAIDPRVLDPAGPKGAKLDALLERLHELRAEGHRALVFTQFLGSMAAVRERLSAEGIDHHELDGSTPAAERARRIEAFQAGEGDVFLLSLRAGGTGVNLTGADYVFHLDPWWNPAVEDQASDRAHRIGQDRPVTIYRLVTEGTIEEKILGLHVTKRQLADDLLAGLDRSESLDVDQLVELLRR
jgi:superfamily II DNA or RNA helicase